MTIGRRMLDRMLWHSGATMIGFVTVLHLWWAVLVSISWDTINTTPLTTLGHLFSSQWLLSSIFVVAAVAAAAGALAPQRFFGLTLMVPQQMILVFAAWGAGRAVWYGAYPDGTVRWWLFILTDQLAMLMLAPAYTVSILVFHNVFRRRGG